MLPCTTSLALVYTFGLTQKARYVASAEVCFFVPDQRLDHLRHTMVLAPTITDRQGVILAYI